MRKQPNTFSSFGALLSCALPGLLASLGAGAVVVSLLGGVPQLVGLSRHKLLLFGFAGVMLLLSGVTTFAFATPAARSESKCRRTRYLAFVVLGLALVIYTIGFVRAFLVD